MSKYETLIFDLDDTLIDNHESIKYAFKIMLEELFIPYTEELFLAWKNADKAYWHIWESGNMEIPKFIQTKDEKITYLRANRFIKFFGKLSYEEAIYLNDIYCANMGVNIVEVPNAKEVLESLKNYYEIIIATNGPKEAAFDKLSKTKIDAFISKVITPEEIGIGKPSKEFFDYLTMQVNQDRNKMLLIGDSLTTDIKGGMDSNIDTYWFNPKDISLPKEYKPTMTVNKLLELKKKL